MQRTGEAGGKERIEYEKESITTEGGKKLHQWGWENGANQSFAWRKVRLYLHAQYAECQMITECATFF